MPDLRACLLASVFSIVAGFAAVPTFADDAVTPDRLLNADQEPGNWITHHKNYSAQRFSPLDQINGNTVKNLRVAWTYQMGGIEGGGIFTHGGLEGTPIAENGMLYVTDGWGSVYKLDTRGGQGKLLWKNGPEDRP
jgi:alcohol dehydrogenase (cytochrome c)